MTLFEDVTNRVKNVARELSEKIHYSATVNRVKMMISREEKQLQAELASLGTACFEQYKNPAAEADFSDHFERVEKIQSRIVALQMKLHDLYMEQAEKKTADKVVVSAPVKPVPPTEGTLQFEEAAGTIVVEAGFVSREKEPEPENFAEENEQKAENVPKEEEFREDTISQLVDVVAEEAGSPDHDSDAGGLDDEIVSRNQS